MPKRIQCAIVKALILPKKVDRCAKSFTASRKLKWHILEEELTGNAPDITAFCFHFWEEMGYFDPTEKQPHDG